VQGPDGDVLLTALPRFPEAEADAVAGGLLAPMPGSVLAVHVSPGDSVRAGQLLMIVEAMKMEHRITAPHAGTVGEVRAHPGDQVTGGDLLAVIEPAGDGGRGERAEGDRAGGEPSEGAAP
jgi:propionyl-CoA carboxylase alpha chain